MTTNNTNDLDSNDDNAETRGTQTQKHTSDNIDTSETHSPQERIALILQQLLTSSDTSQAHLNGVREIVENQSTAIDSLIDLHTSVYQKLNLSTDLPDDSERLLNEILNAISGKLNFHYVLVQNPDLQSKVDPTRMQVIDRIPIPNGLTENSVTQVIASEYSSMIAGEYKTRRPAKVIATEKYKVAPIDDTGSSDENDKTSLESEANSETADNNEEQPISQHDSFRIPERLFPLLAILSLLLNIILLFYLFPSQSLNSPDGNHSINHSITETDTIQDSPTPYQNTSPDETSDVSPDSDNSQSRKEEPEQIPIDDSNIQPNTNGDDAGSKQ